MLRTGFPGASTGSAPTGKRVGPPNAPPAPPPRLLAPCALLAVRQQPAHRPRAPRPAGPTFHEDEARLARRVHALAMLRGMRRFRVLMLAALIACAHGAGWG